MEKILTAEELFKYYAEHTALSESHYDYLVDKEDFIEALHKFAKLHVEAALKQASENVAVVFEGAGYDADAYVDKKSILNSYPLDNIK
jgi:hypothetical protein